jgi:glycosyltransferase involved in cell wall biosynthesis
MAPHHYRSEDISVVITTYNGAPFIAETLTSVLAQTAPVGEVIVVDDASSDDTAAIVARVAGNAPVTLHRLTTNVGRAEARNLGASVASGHWIACLDQDDVWLPQKIDRQLEFINAYEGERPLVAVGSKGRHINARGKDVGGLDFGLSSLEEYDRVKERHSWVLLPHSSAVIDHTSLIESGGYLSEYDGVDDAELWSRLGDRGILLNVPAELILFRKHVGSSSLTGYWAMARHQQRLTENLRRKALGLRTLSVHEFTDWHRDLPRKTRARLAKITVSIYCYKKGSSHSANAQYLRGAPYLLCALVLNPKRVVSGLRRFRM